MGLLMARNLMPGRHEIVRNLFCPRERTVRGPRALSGSVLGSSPGTSVSHGASSANVETLRSTAGSSRLLDLVSTSSATDVYTEPASSFLHFSTSMIVLKI